MGRKPQNQFWKAQEGDIPLAVLHYATSHKPGSIKKDLGWETRGKASCRVKAAVLCVFFRGHGSCCLFQRGPRATHPAKAMKDGFVRLLPTSQPCRQRGTRGKQQPLRGTVGTAGRQGLGSRGAGGSGLGLPPPVPGRGKMRWTAGRGEGGVECFTPSKQEQMGLGLNTTRD